MKKFRLLFVVFVFVFLFVGCGKNKTSYVLESKKYTDISFVKDNIRIICDDGLWYIERNDKIISKGYNYINSLSDNFYGEYNEELLTNFIGNTLDNKLVLLDNTGKEKVLKNEYQNFPNYVDGGLIGYTKDNKFVIISYDGGEDEHQYDSMMVVKRENARFIIAYNVDENYNRTYYLLKSDGTPIINGCDLITDVSMNVEKKAYYFIIKNNNIYRIANGSGEYLDNESYDYVQTERNIIYCRKTTNYYTRVTIYNNQYQKISIDTLDSQGNTKVISFYNEYLINYHDNNTNKDVIKTFLNKETVYDSCERNFFFTCYKGDKIIYIDYKGVELYTETYNVQKKPNASYLNNEFILHSNAYNIYFTSYNGKSLTLIDDLYNDPSVSNINVLPTGNSGVFRVSITKNGVNKNAFFSPNYTNVNKLSLLTYYDSILNDGGGLPFFIVKDSINNQFILINLENGKELNLGKTYESKVFNKMNVSINKIRTKIEKDKEIEVLSVGFYYYDVNKVIRDNFILYFDQIVDEKTNSVMRIAPMGEDITTVNTGGYIYSNDESSGSIYSFVYTKDHYELQDLTTTKYPITSIIYDEDKSYIIITNKQNKFGLCDMRGNILIYPQFSEIRVQNDNVIVKKYERYGVIKIERDGKYKQLSNIIYKNIGFIGDGNYIVYCVNDSKFYFNADGSMNEDEITYTSSLNYYISDSESDNGYKKIYAVKLDFGGYVKLYYNKEKSSYY